MKLIIISVIFVAIAMLLLSIKVIIKKDGRFPSSHVGANDALRKKGITCHTSQHREAQNHKNIYEIDK